jgi:hypothetical protein
MGVRNGTVSSIYMAISRLKGIIGRKFREG